MFLFVNDRYLFKYMYDCNTGLCKIMEE